ncbi:MAG: protein-tyrosine phosphatase family protein [Rhodobacteraceae bacterium]|nr:protein-tyrosine phosphatase family protein [Paracoccaceae bacterium]
MTGAHPLEIAAVRPAEHMGLVGLTFAPGKTQAGAMTGTWERDLARDLDTIEAWNASAVVTLVEEHELHALQIAGLGQAVEARYMAWVHAPIRDYHVPCAKFEATWAEVGPGLRARVRDGANVLIHCKGGLGRAGTIVARLLAELGMEHGAAIKQVRKVRPGAIETAAQLDHVMGCAPVKDAVPDTSPEAVRDRAIGALLGLAVGDALGTTGEFQARDSYLSHRLRLTNGERFALDGQLRLTSPD